jgi:hypothetical protein
MELWAFLKGQLGLDQVTSQLFWWLIFEALGVSYILKKALSAFRSQPIQTRVYWATVPVLVLFLALQFNRAVGAPPEKLPNLTFEVQARKGIGETAERKGVAFASLVVRISNTGEPTSLVNYGLIAQILTQPVPFVGDRLTIPKDGIAIPVENQVELLCGSDALEARTVEPVPHGGQRIGRLLFQFKSLAPSALGNSKLTLMAVDSWGKTWAVPLQNNVDVASNEVRNWPSLHQNPNPQPPSRESLTSPNSDKGVPTKLPVGSSCL